MPQSASGPVARALSHVLADAPDAVGPPAHNAGGRRVLCYSDPDHFSYLWGLAHRADEPEKWFASRDPLSLVVLWDGLPPPRLGLKVHTARYLTPLDWAVALALRLRRADAASLPELRVWVLEYPDTPPGDARTFFDFLGARGRDVVPWLRRARFVAPDLGRTLRALRASDVPSLRASFPAFAGAAVPVARQWQAAILAPAEPDDHHALSNLIGPFALMRDAPAGADPHTAATARLLEWLDVIRREPPAKAGPGGGTNAPPTAAWADRAGLFAGDAYEKRFRALLADDGAFAHGWAEVVQAELGGLAAPVVRSSDPAEQRVTFLKSVSGGADGPVLDLFAVGDPARWIGASIQGPTEAGALRFRLGVAEEAAGGAEPRKGPLDWLFLDLRLFQGRPIADERDFISGLVKRVEELGLEADGERFGDLEKVRTWVREAGDASARKHPHYPAALSLPARVLSALDPGLPVVVFAATGRRDVVGPLRDFPNVVTAFEKPRVQVPPPENIAAEARAKFAAAVARAVPLARARRLCRALLDAPALAPRTRLTGGPGEWRAELYLDESGNEDVSAGPPRAGAAAAPGPGGVPRADLFSVGGLLAVYPPGTDPEKVNEVVRQKFKAWYPSTLAGLQRTQDIEFKRFLGSPSVAGWFLRALVPHLAARADCAGVTFRGVRVTQRIAPGAPNGGMAAEGFGDKRFRRLLPRLVEGVAYALLPELIPDRTVRLGVFAGVRLSRCLADSADGKLMRGRWGMRVRYRDGLFDLYEPAAAAREFLDNHGAALENVLAAAEGAQNALNHLLARIDEAGRTPNIEPLIRAAEELRDFLIRPDPPRKGEKGQLVAAAHALVDQLKRVEAGTTEKPPERRLQTFGPDDLRPLIDDVLHVNSRSRFRVVTDGETLRAFSINNPRLVDDDEGRVLNYFADTLLGSANVGAFVPLFAAGFDDEADDDLEQVLRANRSAVREDPHVWAEALATGGPPCLNRLGGPANSLYRIVGRRLRRWSADLPPGQLALQFPRLARLLDDAAPGAT